jgi:hypothetical protein
LSKAFRIRVPEPLKRVGESLAVEAALEVIRGYLLERLRGVKAEDIYKAIKEDLHTWNVAEDKDRQFGVTWAKKFPQIEKYKKYFTPKLVFEWLRQDRPDIASLILNMNPDGMKWLEKDVEIIKQNLWPKEEQQ